VRLKGGDPMLFGRAQEEIDALVEAGIAVEVVPGVTAALAASAQIGVSLTRRALARSVVFATPAVGVDEARSDWAAGVVGADTAVLYMSVRDAGAIASELIARGKPSDLPVAVVRNASQADSEVRYLTLDALRAGLGDDPRPAVLCLGEVYREALNAARDGGIGPVKASAVPWPLAAGARCR